MNDIAWFYNAVKLLYMFSKEVVLNWIRSWDEQTAQR